MEKYPITAFKKVQDFKTLYAMNYSRYIFIPLLKASPKGSFFFFDMMVIDMYLGFAAVSRTSLEKVPHLFVFWYEKALNVNTSQWQA